MRAATDLYWIQNTRPGERVFNSIPGCDPRISYLESWNLGDGFATGAGGNPRFFFFSREDVKIF